MKHALVLTLVISAFPFLSHALELKVHCSEQFKTGKVVALHINTSGGKDKIEIRRFIRTQISEEPVKYGFREIGVYDVSKYELSVKTKHVHGDEGYKQEERVVTAYQFEAVNHDDAKDTLTMTYQDGPWRFTNGSAKFGRDEAIPLGCHPQK